MQLVMLWFVVKQALAHAETMNQRSSSAGSVCSTENVTGEGILLLRKLLRKKLLRNQKHLLTCVM